MSKAEHDAAITAALELVVESLNRVDSCPHCTPRSLVIGVLAGIFGELEGTDMEVTEQALEITMDLASQAMAAALVKRNMPESTHEEKKPTCH